MTGVKKKEKRKKKKELCVLSTIEELLKGYPNLKDEDIRAALAYSADVISREELLVSEAV